jgi:uncharacterized RDD family membrane protein YckC
MAHNQIPQGPGVSWQPAAVDYTRLLDGVRTRRMLSFLVDYSVVSLIWLVMLLPVFILGIVTFGLAWMILPPLWAVVALFYVGTTMSGPAQATWGMRFFSIRLERLDGTRVDFMTAVVHAVLFWFLNGIFPPLLLVSLFTEKKQLIQDILLGTFVARSDR